MGSARGRAGAGWVLVFFAGCAGGGDKRPDPRFVATQELETLSPGPESLPRYCEILAGIRPDRLAPRDRLIRAVFYRRFHRMQALELLHGMSPQEQQRCRILFDLERAHGRDVDLLTLAFAEAVQVAGGGNIDPSQVPSWVLEERERVFGDFFRSRAEAGVLDTAAFADRAPPALIRELERMTNLELAIAYQGTAWQRALDTGRPQEANRAALIGACEAAAQSAEALAAIAGRAPEFSADHTILSRSYRDLAQRLLGASSPLEASLPRISDFGNFDRAHHFREGRQRMSMAVAEMNDGKGARACRFLLDALKHLLFAQQLATVERFLRESRPAAEDANLRTLDDYLAAIFANYDRLTAVAP